MEIQIIGPNTAAQTRQAIARDEHLARERIVADWQDIQRRHRRNQPTTDVCARCGGPYSDNPPCCNVG